MAKKLPLQYPKKIKILPPLSASCPQALGPPLPHNFILTSILSPLGRIYALVCLFADIKKPANNVSMFLFTLESTALLLKSFYLHLLLNLSCLLLCSLKPILGIVTVQNLQEVDYGVQFRKVSARPTLIRQTRWKK